MSTDTIDSDLQNMATTIATGMKDCSISAVQQEAALSSIGHTFVVDPQVEAANDSQLCKNFNNAVAGITPEVAPKAATYDIKPDTPMAST
ncbi:MAG: hypothetical protein KTR28_02840 [Micavibrio sp.]|nr:hypothetical protein [Micavibrio sp.]